MTERKTFTVFMACSGDVPKGVDPKALFFNLGLDGKLRAYRDINHKQPVRIRLGSTAVTRVKG